MNRKLASLIACFALLLGGCMSTPQAPMPLAKNFYENKEQVVGVYLAELPKTNTHLVGADCLLCLATAAAMNSSLTSHIKTLGVEELAQLDEAVVKLVSQKGVKAVSIKTPLEIKKLEKFKEKLPNAAKKDFRALKDKLGVDKLVVIKLATAGAYRPYSGYIPTGAPVGTITGLAYMVDLNTNQYDLYENIDFKINVQGEWDEPPTFPGVTSAYYQAVEMTKDKVSHLFF